MYHSNNKNLCNISFMSIIFLIVFISTTFSVNGQSLNNNINNSNNNNNISQLPVYFKLGCNKLTVNFNSSYGSNPPLSVVLQLQDEGYSQTLEKTVESDDTVFEDLSSGMYKVSIVDSNKASIWTGGVEINKCENTQSAPTEKQIIMIVCLVGGLVTVSLVALFVFNYIKRDKVRYNISKSSSNHSAMVTQRTPPGGVDTQSQGYY